MLACDCEHFSHVAAQTKNVNGNKSDNGLLILVDQFVFDFMTVFLNVASQRRRRDVVGARFDVDENRGSSDARNAATGRKKRICGSDYRVSESDFERHQAR